MKKNSWLCIILVMVLLVGCGVSSTDSNVVLTEDDHTENATTTTEQSPLNDSVFDEPQYGDEKPVKTDNPSDITSSEEDKNNNAEENQQSPNENNQENSNDNTSGNGSTSNLPAPGSLSYEEFMKLTPEQQQSYQESYGLDEAGLSAFFKWYSEAKAQYEKEHPPEEIPSDGKVELG